MANYVKFMRGSHAAYDKLPVKDADTIYFLSDKDDVEGSLYLGSKLIAGPDNCIGGVSTLGQLTDVIISEGLDYEAILMFDPIDKKWHSYNFDTLLFAPATADVEGKAGFVPAPSYAERNLFLRGDGVWATIGTSGQIFEIKTSVNETHEAALARAIPQDTILNIGDIAIIQDFIANGKYQHTSYVYNGSKWCAMDGNYNAENVYFKDDFIFTEPVGTIEIPDNGRTVVAAAGKNLKELFEAIFTEEKIPTITQPSINIHTPNNMSYEVGTKVIPTYEGSYDIGKYEFGPTTGVTVSNWKAEDSLGNIIVDNAQTGSFNELTVTDDISYWIKLQADFSDGTIPLTNLGNNAENKITAATYSITSPSTITGYRKSFWGALSTKEELTSNLIRTKLNSSTIALVNGSSVTIDIPVGTLRVVVAYPDNLRNMISVLDENDANTNIVSGFGNYTLMSIEGDNNYKPINYKVYVLDFAKSYDTNNKFKVTI